MRREHAPTDACNKGAARRSRFLRQGARPLRDLWPLPPLRILWTTAFQTILTLFKILSDRILGVLPGLIQP